MLFCEPRTIWKAAVVAYALLALMAGVEWFFGRLPGFAIWVAVGLALTAGGWTWQLRQTKHLIVVSRKTIRILGQQDAPEVRQMRNVAGASWDFVTGDVMIRLADTSEVITIKRRFLASNREAKRLAKEINRITAERDLQE